MEYKLARIGYGDKIHVAELWERDGDTGYHLVCGCSDSNSSYAGNRNTLFDIERLNSCKHKLCKVSKIVVENLNLNKGE
jgi:hypothetical protein